jgi:hypothetical protein
LGNGEVSVWEHLAFIFDHAVHSISPSSLVTTL